MYWFMMFLMRKTNIVSLCLETFWYTVTDYMLGYTVTLYVLYVNDEPGLLELWKLFLEAEWIFTVDTLASARQALTQLKSVHYDAVISEYQMPDMNCIAFLVEGRTKLGEIPVILFRGKGREEVVIRVINRGGTFFLCRAPVSPSLIRD